MQHKLPINIYIILLIPLYYDISPLLRFKLSKLENLFLLWTKHQKIFCKFLISVIIIVERKSVEIRMQKFNNHGDYKNYEILTNRLIKKLRIEEINLMNMLDLFIYKIEPMLLWLRVSTWYYLWSVNKNSSFVRILVKHLLYPSICWRTGVKF